MMTEGGMIDTNSVDGVAFPISMSVRELKSRSQKGEQERDEDGWEGREKLRERSEFVKSLIW